PIFMKAYGSPKTAMIHGPATFSGMGEACCTAIEALNVLYDEGLIDNAAEQGTYLLDRLNQLQRKHPKIIKEVRGKGLMVGLELSHISGALPLGVRRLVSVLDARLQGSHGCLVGAVLFRDYDVLVSCTECIRNAFHLGPPLTVGRAE